MVARVCVNVCVGGHLCNSACHVFMHVSLPMSSGFNVLKNLCMYCALCSALVLYINMCHQEVLPNVFPVRTQPVSRLLFSLLLFLLSFLSSLFVFS